MRSQAGGAVGAEAWYQELFFKVIGSTTIIPDKGLILCTSGSCLRLSKRCGPGPVQSISQGGESVWCGWIRGPGVFMKLHAAWGENHCLGPVSFLFRWA